ncbi:MAG: hypothetical protein QM785_13860 [Pyrinomonadaceae bacterium]
MKKKLSDEQLDQVMLKLMSDSNLDESQLDDIADSPSIWWGIQRNIRQTRSPWPPPARWLRIFFIGAPATAVVLLALLFLFLDRSSNTGIEQAKTVVQDDLTPSVEQILPYIEPTADAPKLETVVSKIVPSRKPKFRSNIANLARNLNVARVDNKKTTLRTPETSVKTDFIALSYANNPESGQIVRVKVPRSMMVTLGVVSSVEQPTGLVDAEVLVGDDGLTHSIRFIRKGL